MFKPRQVLRKIYIVVLLLLKEIIYKLIEKTCGVVAYLLPIHSSFWRCPVLPNSFPVQIWSIAKAVLVYHANCISETVKKFTPTMDSKKCYCSHFKFKNRTSLVLIHLSCLISYIRSITQNQWYNRLVNSKLRWME